MRAVNLLPKDVGASRSRRSLGPVGLVASVGAALVAVALSAGFIHAQGAVDSKRSELEAARAELAVTPKPSPNEKPAAGNELAAERAQRAEALGAAYAKRVAWDRILRRFALVLPDDIWLTGLNATAPGTAGSAAAATGSSSSSTPAAPGGPTAGAPTGFTITGHAYSHEGVARLLSRLEVLPDLTNVQLQTSTRLEVEAGNVIQFTIVADVRSGESA